MIITQLIKKSLKDILLINDQTQINNYISNARNKIERLYEQLYEDLIVEDCLSNTEEISNFVHVGKRQHRESAFSFLNKKKEVTQRVWREVCGK